MAAISRDEPAERRLIRSVRCAAARGPRPCSLLRHAPEQAARSATGRAAGGSGGLRNPRAPEARTGGRGLPRPVVCRAGRGCARPSNYACAPLRHRHSECAGPGCPPRGRPGARCWTGAAEPGGAPAARREGQGARGTWPAAWSASGWTSRPSRRVAAGPAVEQRDKVIVREAHGVLRGLGSRPCAPAPGLAHGDPRMCGGGHAGEHEERDEGAAARRVRGQWQGTGRRKARGAAGPAGPAGPAGSAGSADQGERAADAFATAAGLPVDAGDLM